jgi:hypothetical protein
MTDNFTQDQQYEVIPGRYIVGWKDSENDAYLSEPDCDYTAQQVIDALLYYLKEGATEWWCEFSVAPAIRGLHQEEGAS